MANVTQEESLASEIVRVVYYSDSRKKLNISGNGSNQIAEMIEFLDNFYKNLGEPNYVLVGLYVPLIAIATVANILVVLVVCKNQCMKSATNYFVINLCVADLFVTAAKLTRLGKEKYSLRAPGSKERYVYYEPLLNVCHENLTTFGPHGHYLGVGWFALVYLIPVFIILNVYVMMARTLYAKKPPLDPDIIEGSVSHQQGCRIVHERRIAHVLLTLAVLFALCWFPYNVLRVLLDLGVITNHQLKGDVLSYCLVFGHGNSMLNPLVYCCMTRTFRRSISELLRQAWRGITKCRSLRNALPAFQANPCDSYHLVAPNNLGSSMINIASPTDQHCKDDLRVERIRTKSLDDLTMPLRRLNQLPKCEGEFHDCFKLTLNK